MVSCSKIMTKYLRVYSVIQTRLSWGWRFHRLGRRCNLRRALLVNCPRSVEIGNNVSIERDFILSDLSPYCGSRPKIIIGDNCMIMFRFQCNAAESVKIGNHVLIASNVLITDSDHVVEPDGLPVTQNKKLLTKPVQIGNNCWIGQNAVILKGVTIGDNCIIGANSVVTRDVKANTVAAGIPARFVKTIE